jgi:hypothetical protein
MRATAAHFDDASRYASCRGVPVDHSIYVHAGSPQTLQEAIKAAETEGEPLTVAFVHKIKAGIRNRSRAQASAATKAKTEIKKARAAVRAAHGWSKQLTVASPALLIDAQKLHREVFALIEELQGKLFAEVIP